MHTMIPTAAIGLLALIAFIAAAHAAWRLARLIKIYRREYHVKKTD